MPQLHMIKTDVKLHRVALQVFNDVECNVNNTLHLDSIAPGNQ